MPVTEKIIGEILDITRQLSAVFNDLTLQQRLFVTKCNLIEQIRERTAELRMAFRDYIGKDIRPPYLELFYKTISQHLELEYRLQAEGAAAEAYLKHLEKDLAAIQYHTLLVKRQSTLSSIPITEKKALAKELEKAEKALKFIKGFSIKGADELLNAVRLSNQEIPTIVRVLHAELNLALEINQKFLELKNANPEKANSLFAGIVNTLDAFGPHLQTERGFYKIDETVREKIGGLLGEKER